MEFIHISMLSVFNRVSYEGNNDVDDSQQMVEFELVH